MQDKNERIGIRSRYRNLLHETDKKKDEFLSPETGRNKLQETLDQANEIFTKVKMPREAAMDSQLMAVLAEYGRQHAQALRTEFIVFQPSEFSLKLMQFLKVPRQAEYVEPAVSPDNWASLGRTVQPCFKKAPQLNYMFGAFERGPPKKKTRVERRKVEKEAISKNAVIPRQVTNMKETERREATTEEVERIFGSLHMYYKQWNRDVIDKSIPNEQPLCYFEFVINPHSFGQTIENIFYTSFLVRDGHVRIFLDDDRLPVIEPVEQKEGEASTDAERHQVVISMSKAEWQEIIEKFNIKEPLIATRKPVSQ